MKNKLTIFLLGAAAVLLLGAAASTTYRGTFIGNGASLTNASGVLSRGTYNGLSVAVFTNLIVTGTNTSEYVVLEYDHADNSLLFYDNNGNKMAKFLGGASPTNNLSDVIALDVVANNFYGNGGHLTNITFSPTNTLSSLTVQGAVGADGIVGAIRRSAGQTNDIFQVQTEANGFLFGVESNGVPRAATYRATSTNNFILRDDNGGSWILRVSTGGTLSAVTNTTRL